MTVFLATALASPARSQAAPAGTKAPADAPSQACGDGTGWQAVPGVSANVTTLAGSSSFDGGRVFAGSSTNETLDHLWSGRVTDFSFEPVNDFANPDRQVSEAVVSDAIAGDPTRVWVSLFEDGGVFGSRTGARQTFTQMGSLTGWVMELAATPGGVFAAASRPDERGVWRWEGQKWQVVNQASFANKAELETPYLNVLAASADGSVLYLGTDTKGLLRSTDGGVTWTRVWDKFSSLGGATVRSVAVDPRDKSRVAAGLGMPVDAPYWTGERGLRITEGDGGVDSFFTVRDVDLVPAIAFSQKDPAILFAATYGRGIYASYDGGHLWRLIPPPSERSKYIDALLTIVTPNNPACELLFAGAIDGLWVRRVVRYDHSAYVPVAWR